MFFLELNYLSGIAESQRVLVKQSRFSVGKDPKSQLIIDDRAELPGQVMIVRGIGGEFSCLKIGDAKVAPNARTIAEKFIKHGRIAIGDIELNVTLLDSDLKLNKNNSIDLEAQRIIKSALTFKKPEYPCVAVLGGINVVVPLIDGKSIMIGRSAENDLKLDQASISGKHARVSFDNGKFIIEDLASTNGTYIDGQKISGSVSALGGTVFKLANETMIICIANKDDLLLLGEMSANQITPAEEKHVFPIIKTFSELVKTKQKNLLIDSRITIGRDPANEIWVNSQHVSRKHAQIRRDPTGKVYFIDTSSNGVYVRNERLPKETAIELPEELIIFDFRGGLEFGICFSEDDLAKFNSRYRKEKEETEKQVSEDLSVTKVKEAVSLPELVKPSFAETQGMSAFNEDEVSPVEVRGRQQSEIIENRDNKLPESNENYTNKSAQPLQEIASDKVKKVVPQKGGFGEFLDTARQNQNIAEAKKIKGPVIPQADPIKKVVDKPYFEEFDDYQLAEPGSKLVVWVLKGVIMFMVIAMCSFIWMFMTGSIFR
jgi:pSer/pThr/pTyr-binding forkhead associated (FHA) protein